MGGMRTLVMGDVHGAYSAMMQCLERSQFDDQHDLLIQLGDIADGYAQVYECVEELLKIKHLVAIRGNHDDWFHEFIQVDLHPYFWNFGGKGTLTSYLNHAGKNGRFFKKGSGYKTALASSDIPDTHKAFFEGQWPYYIDGQNRCFVHGGFKRDKPFHGQATSAYYLDRDLWTTAISCHNEGGSLAVETSFSEIYIGHTATAQLGVHHPLNACNIWNIDTGAGASGRLTIMDVDTKEYWQSDRIPTLYRDNLVF
ncbi:MAG: metallophosphoesterase [Bacteroidetes bacterium]|nr:metallophosphoesterase [Bacteroidota bacterium]